MSGTGDVRNNLRKLLARLRGVRYPGDIDCVGWGADLPQSASS